ncbi:ring-cleaving dioxygenase [Haloarchaeobius litoreus]|uniref:Ring-cleaving dioxygenase n=1 Tax=Haloarchaeobius litoreus TaxID=755306 RepID=A0ABD6DGG4_9EURY|nr:ring-cleaving dioxygenase [Haloarchaeobius litoreus]
MTDTDRLHGIHHVTAVAADPAENVAFYTDVLGLRMVKQTVNFDDVTTYHLYYGDETGTPGTAMTFFPFGQTRQGRVGKGMTSATAFRAPEGSLSYWQGRLSESDADVTEPVERFGETVLPFRDPDGQPLELVFGEDPHDDGAVEPWGDGPVPTEHALRGFAGVTLLPTDPESTADVLATMGYEATGTAGDRTRYEVPDRAGVVDVLDRPDAPAARPGAGTVHHVAFRTPDSESELAWREKLLDAGQRVTEQKDRQYFQSIYYREPGGVLFEIATNGPGFTADESVEDLGSGLKLPPWLEGDRERIEANLAPLSVRETEQVTDGGVDDDGGTDADDETAGGR